VRDNLASLLLALQFLTRLPVPAQGIYSAQRMARAVGFFPLAGCLVGAIMAAVFLASAALLPMPVAVCIALCSGLLLTGAFHEDGLADTFDGLGGHVPAERALEIMRDSRLGSYGTLALIASLALRYTALVSLTPLAVCIALVAGHGLSRLSSVLVIAGSRYVREEGTGKPVADGVPPGSLRTALATGALLLLAWSLLQPLPSLLPPLAGLVLGHLWMRRFVEGRIGGYTGDTLGAVQQASEVGFYLGFAAALSAG